MRRWSPIVLLSLLGLGCPGAVPGTPCKATDTPRCDGSLSVFACVNGAWAQIPCEGSAGCREVSGTATCDLSTAFVGHACPPGAAGSTSCSQNPPALVLCRDGAWQLQQSCLSCDSSVSPARCVNQTGGGAGGGTAGGGSAGGSSGGGAGGGAAGGTGGGTAGGASGGGIGGGVAGGSGGGGGTGGGAPPDGGVGPCMGVPEGGQCLSSTTVQLCSIGPNGVATIQTYPCAGTATCQTTSMGAVCVSSSTCRSGDDRCASGTTIQSCSGGVWGTATSCGTGSACVSGPVGAYCSSGLGTTSVSARLRYEKRPPLPNFSDWDALQPAPARRVTVFSGRLNASNQLTQLHDETATDNAGAFTIKVPSSPTAQDVVVFYAMGGDGLGIRIAVVDPQLGAGSVTVPPTVTSPRYWSWSTLASSLPAGGILTVTDAQGSGALNVYDAQQAVWKLHVGRHQGREPKTLVMWLGMETSWSCGACFLNSTQAGFDTQIFVPGVPENEAYWSDYMLNHELGHWAMSSYGRSPGEGGTHYLTCQTFPGQAWSEGYATWHSGFLRNTSVMYDKQNGGFFWFNIGSRLYYPDGGSRQKLIKRTDAGHAEGLLQAIDENDVAAMLWTVSSARPTAGQEVLQAVASTHMTSTPFARNYTRHTWTAASNCTFSNVVDTGTSTPHFADELDALRCATTGASVIDPATVPATYYPFPSASPLCDTTLCYGCRSGASCVAGTTPAACGTGGADCLSCNGSCVNGVCQ